MTASSGVPPVVYQLINALFGPNSMVPWWAWVAVLVMIFWGLLVSERQDG